jgi:hypothetical protein
MNDGITQFCVCREEMCFCTNTTAMPLDQAAVGVEWECPECADGHHVWVLDGPRS